MALTGAWPKKENNPNVPMTPAEISEDIYACWKAGAAVAHMHMRDDDGNGTMDVNKFRETVELLRKNHPECDIVLNMSVHLQNMCKQYSQCWSSFPERPGYGNKHHLQEFHHTDPE